MTLHLQREIERLKKMILGLSARAEESVRRAARSIAERDPELAQRVIGEDPEIDEIEVVVEEECLKILALHQPVAIDLRYIVAVLKINNDLERVGDLAVNISETTLYLAERDPIEMPFDFTSMAGKVQEMLSKSLDALVNLDADLASEVRQADEEVDRINREMYELVEQAGRRSPEDIDGLIRLLAVSRDLERIGDHATNIAEDVIYMQEGRIVRHGS